jgi:sugar phosphate isomerase/epimerase
MVHPTLDRRRFLTTTGLTAAAALTFNPLGAWALEEGAKDEKKEKEPLYRISLAEWSLHRTLQAGKLTNLDFPKVTKKDLGIDAVEYVNAFFKDKAEDKEYLKELKQRCDDLEVRSLLIMCDGEGHLGDPNEAARKKAVENHHRWVSAAKYLGCHSIRVNAHSSGSYEEQRDRAADGLSRLGDFADQHGINVIVENHGGLSSNGKWLKEVMELCGRPNVGTLPDFGNFGDYDRYQGVKELMPYAKGVSAKSHEFDEEGNEKRTDYHKMMKIVLAAKFNGYVGIEWEGGEPDEMEGIRLTKKLLERVRDDLTKEMAEEKAAS